jgi:hypothetical protein
MKAAAAELKFELAGRLRDEISELKYELRQIEKAGHAYNHRMPKSLAPKEDMLVVKGARVHNLKNLNLEIPKNSMVVFTGLSGSGKSYFARGIAENYKKLFPEREIYLISKLTEDETLDKMKIGKPKRISLESLVEDFPSIDEFKECLVIFDDYDTLTAPYDKVVLKLIDDLAIMGRHTGTSMLVLSHYLTNYKKTRLILGEAHFLVLYPMATSFKAMKYVCEHHCGLTKDEVQGLKKLGRWVCIHKVYPQYLIASQDAYLLNQ